MRNIYIDCLRGISIFLVMALHGLASHNLMYFITNETALLIVNNGEYGVTIFFVVSGFLITRRSIEIWGSPGAVVPSDFYTMRVARILPPLLVFLATCAALHFAGFPAFTPANPNLFYQGVSAALTFQYNTFFVSGGWTDGMRAMGPLWSLSIEEMFYLAFPLVMITLKKRSLVVLLLLIVCFQGPAARTDLGRIYGIWGTFDALAFGCLAGLLTSSVDKIKHPLLLAYPAMCLGLTLIFETMTYDKIQEVYSLGPSVVALGAAIFLVGASYAKATDWRFPNNGVRFTDLEMLLIPLATLGALSYELYLFHAGFILLLQSYGIEPRDYSVFPILVMTALAAVMNIYFTEPCNKAIRRFYSPRHRSDPQKSDVSPRNTMPKLQHSSQ